MKKATVEWLQSAEMDLETLAHISQLEHLTPVAAFHAQQCVEKCLKAVLEENSQKVLKEHSTLRLYGLVKKFIRLDIDTAILTDLDTLYIDARYPGEFGLLPSGRPTLADVKQLSDLAKNIHDQVMHKL
jgi:HEPN domain-containing protein